MDLADPSSETAREFKGLVSDLMAAVGEPNMSDFFPFLRRMDIQGIRRRLTGYTAGMSKMLDRFIDGRVMARKESNYRPVNDVLDVLLDICEENNDELDRTNMQHLLMDLFAAGTDTTSITLEWAMAELIHNPAILSRVREETDRVIGRGNLVQESDTASLPYLQAVVKETFRMHPSTPFLIPRRAREDTEVMGFTVPRGAQVLVNAFAIGRDPESWEDPDSFRPERFLGSEIDVKGRDFELIPFGAGRRICPGYPLALRMLPLMVASLVQGFDWKPEGGVSPKDMDMEDVLGLALRKARPLRAIPIPVQ
ncbi:hypothetical protein CDL15_Pgr003835 [Punica granatum]|nr:hypothetical protein CDL15_Pgr003835 [Punica granatum]